MRISFLLLAAVLFQAASAAPALTDFNYGPMPASEKTTQQEELQPMLGRGQAQSVSELLAGGTPAGGAQKGTNPEKGFCTELVSPLPGSTLSLPISFSWNNFCELTDLQLWISTSSSFLVGSTWAFSAGDFGTTLTQEQYNEVVANIGLATTYFWTVFIPEFGFTDDSFGSFQVSAPSCNTTLTAPAADANPAFPVTFSWTSDCTGNELLIADGTEDTAIYVPIPVAGNSITLTDDEILANIRPLRRVDTYYWAVRNVAAQTVTPLRPVRFGSLCAAILTGPEPNAGVKPPARFTWTLSGQCTQQFIYFYGGDPAPPIILTLPVTTNEYVLSPEVSEFIQILYSPPYFWGVSQQAEINGETGVVSTSGPARPVNLLPVTPCEGALQSPAANASVALPATFSWSATGDCPALSLIVAASDTPSQVVTVPQATATTATLTQALIQGLPLQEEYYWTVGYFLPEFNSSFAVAEFRPFKVSNLACDITLAAPASGAAVSFPATFSWGQLGGCTINNLLFSKQSNGAQPQTLAAAGSPATVSAAQWGTIANALGLSVGEAVYWSVANGSTPLADFQPFFVSQPPAQRTLVSGIVTDGDTATPLAGVAVDVSRSVDGASLGRVSTNATGNYTFEAPNTISLLTLKFSRDGYQSLEFANNTPPATVNAKLFRAKPDAPTGVEAKAGGGQNELRWEPSRSPGVAGYNVYRSSGNLTFAKANIAPLESLDFRDTDVTNLKNYDYYVTAVTAGGQALESEASPIARVQANILGVALADVSGKGNGFVRVPIIVDNAAGIRPKGTQLSVRLPLNLIKRDYNSNGFEKGIKVEGTGVGAVFSFSESDNDPGKVTITSTSEALVPAGNGHIVDIAIATSTAAQQTCGTVKLENVTFVDKFSVNIAALISKQESQLCLEGDCLQADITGDGTVNIGDAVRALAISVDNFTADACAFKAGDLNADREIDAGDSVTIQRIIQDKAVNPGADQHLLPKGGDSIKVEVLSVEVEPGATEALVPIFIENGGAMAGADLNFTFQRDDAVIDLQEIQRGGIAGGFSEDNNVSKAGEGAISYSQADAVGSQGRTTLAVLKFKLNKDIAPGTHLPLRIAEADLKGVAGDSLSWRAPVEITSGEIVIMGNSLVTPQLLVQVNDETNNQPITGATVSVGALPSQVAKEDAAGLYGWPALSPGNYTLSVARAGYQTTTTPVALNNSISVPVRLRANQQGNGPWTLAVINGSRSPNQINYNDGTVVSITANAPAVGKTFDRWTGDTANVANVNAAATTITMRANSTVTATYKDVATGVPFLTGIDPNQGSVDGGNVVTLTGSNLGGATNVNFGGTNRTPQSNTATQITVTAPQHAAGIVTVNVTTPGGTSNGLSYTYLSNGISVLPELREIGPGAATVTFNVTASAGRAWSASEGANWLSIQSPEGGDGEGSGELRLDCEANTTGATREATINISAPTSSPTFLSVTVRQLAQAAAGPVLNGITPATGPASGGTTVTITGTGLSGATGVSFGGAPATSLNVGSDTSLTCVSPAGAEGSVQVIVSTPNGASNSVNFTYTATGGGGNTGGCSCGGKKHVKLEDILADLILSMMVVSALWISNRVWRQK